MTNEVFIGTVNESPKPFIKQVDTVRELSCSRADVFAWLSGSLAIPAVVSLEVTSRSSTFCLSYVLLYFGDELSGKAILSGQIPIRSSSFKDLL